MIGRRVGVILAAAVLGAGVGFLWAEWSGQGQDSGPQAEAPRVEPARAPAPGASPRATVRTARAVAGVALQPDGRPAVGAEIVLCRQVSAWPEWRREPLERVVTGLSGRFEFARERAPDLLVEFDHPDFAGGVQLAPVSQPEIVLQLKQSYDLEGVVVNDAGMPVPLAKVALEATLYDDRETRTVSASTSGRFRFRNVGAGVVRIVARHEWYQPVALPLTVVGSDLRALELRFERPALSLAGRVVAAATQEPVEGAQVLALPTGQRLGRNEPAFATTGKDGSFLLSGLARGLLRIEIRHPEHATASRTVATAATAGSQQFELQPPALVRGRLVGPDAEVWRGAVLSLRSSVGETSTASVAVDGSFAFAAGVTPGLGLLAVAQGQFAFANESSELPVRLADRQPPLSLQVQPPSLLVGRVVDGAGAAVAGAWITAERQDLLLGRITRAGSALLERDFVRMGDQLTRAAATEPLPALAVTDEKGVFRIAGMAPGSISLRIAHPGFGAQEQEVTVPPCGETVTLDDVALPPGCRIRGQVTRGGRPLCGAQVSVLVDGEPIAAVSGVDGAYEIRDVPPGRYRVNVRYSTFPIVRAGETEVGAAAPAAVDIDLPPGRLIRGVVTGLDGQPVERAVVSVRGEPGDPVLSDSSGAFELEAPNRDAELVVAFGSRSVRRLVTAAAQKDRVEVSLAVPANGSVSARVLELPGRKPVAGVLLRLQPLDGSAPAESRWAELDEGALVEARVPAGHWRITFWAEGRAPTFVQVQIRPGEHQDLGALLLEPGSELRGVLRDEAGQPIAGAEVFLGEEADLLHYQAQQRTGPDGSFVVRGVSSLAANLIVRAAGFAWTAKPLRLPEDVLASEPLQVVAARGSTILVESLDDESEGATLLLLRNGRVLGVAEIGADGIAAFENRGVGDYEIQRFGDDHRRLRVRIDGNGQLVRCTY